MVGLWVPTSSDKLAHAEQRMLADVRVPLRNQTVQAGQHAINTVVVQRQAAAASASAAAAAAAASASASSSRSSTPLVLVHGFGGGVGLWANNFDALAQHYDVYAMDVLGFGRSSRPPFSRSADVEQADAFFVDSLEAWRAAAGIERMVLLGHSLGGYITALYAERYPHRVDRLVLAAPFGVRELDEETKRRRDAMPLRMRALFWLATKMSPQALLRAAGPLGRTIMKRTRGKYDMSRYGFDDERVVDYVYHLNAHSASGENAFMALQDGTGFARRPIFQRIVQLPMHVSLIYGSEDFIKPDTGHDIVAARQNAKVDLHVIPGAGHHAYATHADAFHAALRAFDLAASGSA